ncbi:hypothetical protein SAMN05216548_11538 [Faunimonas pinastri]|uniref:Uncharacterized protein n=1 Tax=Faunimonas pinastri TaxID=1855383 RepID=A0A1H9N989_9HYPH|nr:hypothetical protein [Faunimonas pinastri]SER32239.1 hypothetical protein SAMN05216548_11538 [Faunimonas pinastri]
MSTENRRQDDITPDKDMAHASQENPTLARDGKAREVGAHAEKTQVTRTEHHEEHARVDISPDRLGKGE